MIGWEFLPIQTFDKILVPEAGLRFWTALLALADHFFEIESIDLDEEMKESEAVASESNLVALVIRTTNVEKENKASRSGTITLKVGMASGNKDQTVQEQINQLIKDTKMRRHNNSMVMVRIREELDHMINVKKEDKLIVMGVKSAVAMPLTKLSKRNGWWKWLDKPWFMS